MEIQISPFLRVRSSEPSLLDQPFGRGLLVRAGLALVVAWMLLRPDRLWVSVHLARAAEIEIIQFVSQFFAVGFLAAIFVRSLLGYLYAALVVVWQLLRIMLMVIDGVFYAAPYAALRRWARLSGLAAFILAAGFEVGILGGGVSWVQHHHADEHRVIVPLRR